MAIQFNQVKFIGNLGRDPEMRYLPSGKAVTDISVACNREWTNDAGEKVKETTWYRVSVFGKQAESVNQYKHKGDLVLVEGRLRPDMETGGPRIWTGNDGAPRASYEVIANRVVFLPSSGGNGDSYTPPPVEDEDDISF